MEIKGKVFIVTGGASGLGEGTARMLAAHGGKVVVADLQADKGEALARELGGAFVACDVSQEADGQAVVAKAVSLGKLVGLAHGVQRQRRRREPDDLLDHAAEIGAAAIAQEGQAVPRPGRQREHRRAFGVGARERGERLVIELEHLVAVGSELQRLRGMVVRDQQVAAALGQLHHRVVHVERDEPALDAAEALAHAHQPVREEAERERVREREGDRVVAR